MTKQQIDPGRLDHLKALADASRADLTQAQAALNKLLMERSDLERELETLKRSELRTLGAIKNKSTRTAAITERRPKLEEEIDQAHGVVEAATERQDAAGALYYRCCEFLEGRDA